MDNHGLASSLVWQKSEARSLMQSEAGHAPPQHAELMLALRRGIAGMLARGGAGGSEGGGDGGGGSDGGVGGDGGDGGDGGGAAPHHVRIIEMSGAGVLGRPPPSRTRSSCAGLRATSHTSRSFI
jgi:hypothetical protein